MISEPGVISQPNNLPVKKCPYQWMKEFAKNLIENALIKGDLLSFFNMFTEQMKSNIPFLSLGRIFAQHVQVNGKFVSISNVSEPSFFIPGSDIWKIEVRLKSQNDSEYISFISIDGKKKICGFDFSKDITYHYPSYIKKEFFKEEIINKKPLTVITKPINISKNSQYPCALLIHGEYNADIDIRIGLCCPGKDFEYLPSNKIGLIRGEYEDTMFRHEIVYGRVIKYNDPILIFTTKMIENALSRNDISQIFLIIHSYASLSLSSIVKKFQGIIQGIILINPFWNNGPDLCINSIKEEDIPQNVPILLLGGNFSEKNTREDYKNWETALKKLGCECEFYNQCDTFLFESQSQDSINEYNMLERHISDVALRRIAQWIRAHSNS